MAALPYYCATTDSNIYTGGTSATIWDSWTGAGIIWASSVPTYAPSAPAPAATPAKTTHTHRTAPVDPWQPPADERCEPTTIAPEPVPLKRLARPPPSGSCFFVYHDITSAAPGCYL